MARASLIGGPQLKLRLTSLEQVPADFADVWAETTAQKLRETAPNARRPESRTFTTKVRGFRAAVYGAFWWIFVDRGTKAHEILGSGRKNPPNTLMFQIGGRTIFAPKVDHPRTKRNPFISRAAQSSLDDSSFKDTVISRWNRRRIGGKHVAFL